jgi:hypothetical protein
MDLSDHWGTIPTDCSSQSDHRSDSSRIKCQSPKSPSRWVQTSTALLTWTSDACPACPKVPSEPQQGPRRASHAPPCTWPCEHAFVPPGVHGKAGSRYRPHPHMILACCGIPIPLERVHRFSPMIQDQPSHYHTLTPFHSDIYRNKQASPVVATDPCMPAKGYRHCALSIRHHIDRNTTSKYCRVKS